MLLDRPFVGSHRAADMEIFLFGEPEILTDREGRQHLGSPFALHLQCPWRITARGQIVVGSADLTSPRSGIEDDSFDPNVLGASRRDELLEAYFFPRDREPRLVRTVVANAAADLTVRLDDGSALEVFTTASRGFEHESWRFLRRFGQHVVLGSLGLEIH